MKFVHDGILIDNKASMAVLFKFKEKEIWIPRIVIYEFDNTSVIVEKEYVEKMAFKKDNKNGK